MKNVILCGPLAWAPLIEKVIGAPVGARAVVVEDMCICVPNGGFYPVLQFRDGARADGIMVELSNRQDPRRLEYFAAVLGLEKSEQAGIGEGENESGLVFHCPVSEDIHSNTTDVDDWQIKFGRIALAAADEIMGYYGEIAPDIVKSRMQMILSRAVARQNAQYPPPTARRSSISIEDVECLDRKERHKGFFLTREFQLQHPGFDGTMSPEVTREVFVATDAAIVLPYDPRRDRVLLVEQFRMGPYGRGDVRPWTLEPVAGRIDAGETPLETAHRECVEEAGLALHGLEFVSGHYCSPGCSSEFFYCYLGLSDLPETKQGQGGLATEDEDIRTHVLSFDEAMELVTSGEANNGPLVLILLWLQRERDRLRKAAKD